MSKVGNKRGLNFDLKNPRKGHAPLKEGRPIKTMGSLSKIALYAMVSWHRYAVGFFYAHFKVAFFQPALIKFHCPVRIGLSAEAHANLFGVDFFFGQAWQGVLEKIGAAYRLAVRLETS